MFILLTTYEEEVTKHWKQPDEVKITKQKKIFRTKDIRSVTEEDGKAVLHLEESEYYSDSDVKVIESIDKVHSLLLEATRGI